MPLQWEDINYHAMLKSAFPSWVLFVLIFSIGCQRVGDIAPVTVKEENEREGTTAWQMTKVRKDTCRITVPYEEIFLCRNRDIEAYTSRTSAKAGDTLKVFVSTDPAAAYRVSIFRMGIDPRVQTITENLLRRAIQ